MGDFNTAHREIDLARPRENRETSGFLPEERAELDRWLAARLGRHLPPLRARRAATTRWWSQRFGVRARNVGWRIDYVLASPAAMRFVRGAFLQPAGARLGPLPGRRRRRPGRARISHALAIRTRSLARSDAQGIYASGDLTINAALASLSLIYTSYFLTQIAGLRAALAGLVPLVGRSIDAFTDPLMGRISDQTRWRCGRRRPYFLIGALPFGLSFAVMWVDRRSPSQAARFAYYAPIYCLTRCR